MTPPSEFVSIGLDASKFKRATPTEWHGPCPFCGGSDRFRVHTDKDFPHWFCVCREGTGCNFRGWADEINPALKTPLTDEQRHEYMKRQNEQRQAEAQDRARRLQEFSSTELWDELHRRMTATNRQWWALQGLPETAQDYWHLGYTTTAMNYGPAYTIPFFGDGWNVVNMQYRLTNPPEGQDKYRWAGLGYSSYFVSHPDLGVTDEVVICEGAKKAMVYSYNIALDARQVYAIPSKSDFAGLSTLLHDVGRVYIMLDPDADESAVKLAQAIGPNARIVSLTEKADDLVTRFHCGADTFARYFRQAVRV